MEKIKQKFQNIRQERKLKKALKKESISQALSAHSAYDEVILSWLAPEYHVYNKGQYWNAGFFALILISALFGIYFGAWTFSLAIIAFGIAFYLTHKNPPKEVEVVISDIGIKIGNKKYPFNRIKGFWILYEPPFLTTLNIRVEDEFMRDITIQLNNQHPAAIRESLITKIPEYEGMNEPFWDTLTRLLKL